MGAPVVYQPSGNGFTQPAGANANFDAVVNAELTHHQPRGPSTGTQGATSNLDVHMPDASVHDIATPRRTIGRRCRKWCISTQPASGKRKCAACCVCGTQFTHSEAWSNRETNHHHVHAHCVNGGLGHDNELHPKLAADQEAVDAVTRQRDTITRTAADTEVLLPFAQDPDQASTAAPPDDERDLFGREEALRKDEEIMDFQWFEHVTWDSIKDYDVFPTSHEVQVCVAASPTCHSSSHHSQQPHLLGVRVSLESAGAQQLAPSGTTSS